MNFIQILQKNLSNIQHTFRRRPNTQHGHLQKLGRILCSLHCQCVTTLHTQDLHHMGLHTHDKGGGPFAKVEHERETVHCLYLFSSEKPGGEWREESLKRSEKENVRLPECNRAHIELVDKILIRLHVNYRINYFFSIFLLGLRNEKKKLCSYILLQWQLELLWREQAHTCLQPSWRKSPCNNLEQCCPRGKTHHWGIELDSHQDSVRQIDLR